MIDLDVDLNSAVNMFGHFLKYEVSDAVVVPHDREPLSSAFDVMMAAQRQLCLPLLPPRFQKDSLTKKEILHNDLLSLLEKRGLAWEGREATKGCGIRFVKVLVDLLWYIDGRHHVFENQGCAIPKPFSDFKGYNIPESSKHRKCTCENVSQHPSQPFNLTVCVLIVTVLETAQVRRIKPSVEKLAGCMALYCEYLRSQNKKKMKQVHSSEVPVRQLSDSISVEVIQNTSRFPCFDELSAALEKLETYQHLCLSEF